MKQLYVFSGFGADERAFPLFDFRGHVVTFIQWRQPLPGESLTSYARRLSISLQLLDYRSKTEKYVFKAEPFLGLALYLYYCR